jgi:type II secretory pathway pseudopilin PulG
MLLIALVLAVIGLAALVFAVVTSNEFIAYICIAASVLGVILLIVDALRERQRRAVDGDESDTAGSTDFEAKQGTGAPAASQLGGSDQESAEDYPEEATSDAEKASSPREESGAGASAEPGGSDEYDHGTAGQRTAGKDNTDNTR